MSEENTVKKDAAPAAAKTDARPARTDGARPARPQRRGPGGRGGKFQRRRKFCKFCADTSLTVDHKDPVLLAQFISERHKIIPSRVTSTCAKHQRQLTTAIKRARILALLAFTPLHHK
ncbi:MAG: 30S ribosomal protein S18 [Zetaproteobacteria bacterium]|nr:MAG: 30S ribosomal protein S18 [Zetaproteobacteria bacterium]